MQLGARSARPQSGASYASEASKDEQSEEVVLEGTDWTDYVPVSRQTIKLGLDRLKHTHTHTQHKLITYTAEQQYQHYRVTCCVFDPEILAIFVRQLMV